MFWHDLLIALAALGAACLIVSALVVLPAVVVTLVEWWRGE